MSFDKTMRYLFFCVLFLNPLIVLSKTIVTYAGEEDAQDYLKPLLVLALEKTKSDFGDFELVSTNLLENYPRLIHQLDEGVYENFVMKISVTDEILKKYNVIKFPLDRGVTGYRIAFISLNNHKNKCEDVNLEDIAGELTLQGIGWLDTDILNYNHFNVYPVSRELQMVKMIEHNRATYYYRGINEIVYEAKVFPNLLIEPCFALKYPLPRFFVTHKRDTNIAKRIELGLKRAYKDGSLIKLWRIFYIENIRLSNMKDRRVFELKNPFIKTLDDEYLQYNFQFSELNDY